MSTLTNTPAVEVTRFLTDAMARLGAVPWAALEGLGPVLAPALAKILDGQPAERVLDRLLRDHRSFSAPQRQVSAEGLFGVGLWRRRLRAQLGVPDASPLQLLACLARDLGGHSSAPALLDVTLPPPRPAPSDWPSLLSVPDWLAAELEATVGPEAPALAGALNLPGPVVLRANCRLTTRSALAQRLTTEGLATEPCAFAPDALRVLTKRPNLTGLESFREALFEVQDEGSQLLGALVGATPGDAVLDLCAGAGGKTLQLAAGLEGQGALHATDVDASRLDRLRARASRAGARVAIHPWPPPPSLAVSHVLVDAPCSELGALRRGPDLRWRLDPSTFVRWPPTQLELLERGAGHLALEGRLVYATCTLRAAENEGVVDAFLARHPDFRLVRPSLPEPLLDTRGFLRTFPHRHGTDGFFGAVLERTE